MARTEEKRKHRRLELGVPLLFTLQAKSGAGLTRSGFTRDVSPGGIFFRTEAGQGVESHQGLNVKLLIPRQGDPSEATVSLSGEAKVVRIENLPRSLNALGEVSKRWGIAVQFTHRPSVDLSIISTLFGSH